MNPTADGEACNACESCRAFNEQRSYNIHELDAASNNSVDDIRTLIDQVRIPPPIGKYKVFIIDEVHMLTTAAFNAFSLYLGYDREAQGASHDPFPLSDL